VQWTATYRVETDSARGVDLSLLPSTVALEAVEVDGREAPIWTEDGFHVVSVRGAGQHTVTASFEVPVTEREGLPRLEMQLPEVPISRFQLRLPGDKEVVVDPATSVRTTRAGDDTVAVFHVPLTGAVGLTWPEAVPEGPVEVELRANAELVHIAHAEEGVLHVRAKVSLDVTRGSTHELAFVVPPGVLVNDVTSVTGAVSDWRLDDDDRTLRVFFDRQVSGELDLEAQYERPLPVGEGASSAPVEIPLLTAQGMHRQRGMVALLAGRELTLDPRDEVGLTRVGENQLPAAIRDEIAQTVAHTYRYVDDGPRLTAVTAVRVREQGRFDAEVDTLLSLGDVTAAAVAVVSVRVKSGSLDELVLPLPAGVSLLAVSAPSLREHRLEEADDGSRVTVEFTQPMEGELRIELRYERILEEGTEELAVPTVHVEGADVEQGRIAVEALTAVQVEPERTERLTPIDVAEVPRHVLMQATNPILLAFKYARPEPAPDLALRVVRHREVQVQDAAIDDATYQTLYTQDGIAVTVARFSVRNQRKQFLRVALPPRSEVWSARVDGRPETPALAADSDDDEPAVLVNIIHSTEAFPVELVYATRVSSIGAFGRIRGELPRPDMIVTRSRWEVFLPRGVDYGAPRADLTLVEAGVPVTAEALSLDRANLAGLPIAVPTEGVRFTFEKLYAGPSGDAEELSIPYTSGAGSVLTLSASLLGTLLLWLALLGTLMVRYRSFALVEQVLGPEHALATYRTPEEGATRVALSRGAVVALATMAGAGALLLMASVGYLAASVAPVVGLSLVMFAAGGVVAFRDRFGAWRGRLREARATRAAQTAAAQPTTTSAPETVAPADERAADPAPDPDAGSDPGDDHGTHGSDGNERADPPHEGNLAGEP
jgi:hypothetical protein